jgi:hypothetical protein
VSPAGTPRDRLLALLGEAEAFEHAAVLEYLFAATTLKREPDEGLDALALERVREWRRTLLAIAREEMAHLAAVCNFEIAVGGVPCLSVPPFAVTQPASAATPVGGVVLAPLSMTSLARFIALEGPDELDSPAPVSALYDRIRAAITAVGEDATALVVRRPPDLVDSWGVSGHARFAPVTDVPSALRLIAEIVGQSEGGNDDSHLARLLAMRAEMDADPALQPARSVVSNPVLGASQENQSTVIDVPFTAAVAAVHADLYAAMLALLRTYYAGAGALPSRRDRLRRGVRGIMSSVLRPLGELLTGLPARRHVKGAAAGPVFHQPRPATGAMDARAEVDERLNRADTELHCLAASHEAPVRLAAIAENVALARRLLAC